MRTAAPARMGKLLCRYFRRDIPQLVDKTRESRQHTSP